MSAAPRNPAAPLRLAAAPATDGPRLLTAQDVASQLSVSVRTVWRLTSTGEIPAPISIGRASRWSADEIADCVAQRLADRPARAAGAAPGMNR